MNKEFKKILGKKETRYVLEAATGGATSSAAVATGPTSKDNLLTQDKNQPQVQRRNPVAANVNATVGGGGSGAHKDRKRAEKRGEVKHKKDWRKDVDEGKAVVNFDANDIKKLEQIKDLETLKARAFELISKPSAKPMKPEKVEWFKSKLQMLNKPMSIIKLMYDLLLSGEGQAVIGNKSSTNPNSYRQRFGNTEEAKQRLDPKCWTGYKKQGTKMKGGVRVNNCVPKEGVAEGYGMGAYATIAGSEPVAKHVPEQIDSDRMAALSVAVKTANSIVKDIKYDETFMEIVSKITALAEKYNIDVKYEIRDAQEANNNFQSTVYGLVSPFEDALRDERLKSDDDDLEESTVDPGYIDQENGMTTSDLKGLYQQAVKMRSLVKRMGNDATLEPWQQTKIAKAADYVNSVFRSLDDEYGLDELEEAEKKGLWANIHARRKKGLPARKPGEKGAPSQKSWDAAVASSKKKKVGESDLQEYETHTYTDKEGRKWRVDDEGNKDLIYDPNDNYSGRSRYSGRSFPRTPQPKVYYFYNVPTGSAMKAFELGLKRTKSGKWYSSAPIDAATAEFGNPRKWEPKTEESMMPASNFAGTPKNKLGPAAHLKGKMKRPARQGDLVGGSAEESIQKKKDIEEKLNPADPVDTWIDDFMGANPERYHQFRKNNRPGTRKDDAHITRMAKAASYAAKTGKR